MKTDGRSPEPTLAAGTLVGSYLIEWRAACSGFAELYRAHQVAHGQAAAVKVLHAQHASRPSLLRRFRREATLLKRLRHPNIVEFRDSGELHDGRPYIVMEWLEGHTLQQELAERGPMTVAEASALMADIVAALAAAHRLGAVHRDLKVQNIMVIPHGQTRAIKLIDFGIARLLSPLIEAGDHVTNNTILGTPETMAPEQIRGQPADPRTDVYAAGVILYQLVTGRLPFIGRSIHEVQAMHLEAPPPRASEVASVPASIDDIIARCLAKHPGDRYQTVDGFLAHLARAGRPCTDSASPESASSSPPVVAMYVEARVTITDHPETTRQRDDDDDDDDDFHDDILDDVDEVMAAARQVIADERMSIALETSNAVLAVRPATDADSWALARARILELALALANQLDGRDTRHDAVRVLVTVHAAHTDELLRPGAWSSHHPGGGVMATSAAVAGLEAQLKCELGATLTPISGAGDHRAMLLAQTVPSQ